MLSKLLSGEDLLAAVELLSLPDHVMSVRCCLKGCELVVVLLLPTLVRLCGDPSLVKLSRGSMCVSGVCVGEETVEETME